VVAHRAATIGALEFERRAEDQTKAKEGNPCPSMLRKAGPDTVSMIPTAELAVRITNGLGTKRKR
jgi:hypothetical protein